MKLNRSIVITLITLTIGYLNNESDLWILWSIFIAGIIDLFTRQWVMSDRLGSMQSLSIILKSILAFIGLYAALGQLVCFGLIIKWLFL